MSSNTILFEPEPTVQVKSLTAQAVEIELSFRVADVSEAAAAQNEIFDLVFRHAKSAGLHLSPAPGVALPSAAPGKSEATPPSHRTSPLRLLDALPLFAPLTEDEKEALAATMTRRTYRKDQVVVEQGARLDALMPSGRLTQLFIFGNAKAGTPMMQFVETIGIDLMSI